MAYFWGGGGAGGSIVIRVGVWRRTACAGPLLTDVGGSPSAELRLEPPIFPVLSLEPPRSQVQCSGGNRQVGLEERAWGCVGLGTGLRRTDWQDTRGRSPHLPEAACLGGRRRGGGAAGHRGDERTEAVWATFLRAWALSHGQLESPSKD